MAYYTNNRYFKDNIMEYFNELGWKYVNMNNSDRTQLYYDIDYYDKTCDDCKIVNQLNNIDILGNKRLQYESMKKNLSKLPEYIPQTFSFTKKNIDNIKKKINKKLYIVKPENSLARNGVKVISNFKELNDWVNDNEYDNWIIQEYIKSPLLYNNKKFHLRIYAIIIIDNNTFKVYVYKNGFMYLAKEVYNMKSYNDNNIHLSGEGSKEQVKIYPDEFVSQFGYNKYIKVSDEINKLVKETVGATQDSLVCPNIKNKDYKCFKLIGYDILIDANFNAHLLEINVRLISLKYPPINFKKHMYYSILNLILDNNEEKFTKVLNHSKKKLKTLEGFSPSDILNNDIFSNHNKQLVKDYLYMFIILFLIWYLSYSLLSTVLLILVIYTGYILIKKYNSRVIL